MTEKLLLFFILVFTHECSGSMGVSGWVGGLGELRQTTADVGGMIVGVREGVVSVGCVVVDRLMVVYSGDQCVGERFC